MGPGPPFGRAGLPGDRPIRAYGWPGDLTDGQLLEKLVALNHEGRRRRRGGVIKYLRPEFQAAATPDKAVPPPRRGGKGE